MNTLKNLSRVTSEIRSSFDPVSGVLNPRRHPKRAIEPRFKFPASHRISRRVVNGMVTREKPPQPTLIREATVRRFVYLEDRGIADFGALNIFVVPRTYRYHDPITGEITTKKIEDGFPTHAV